MAGGFFLDRLRLALEPLPVDDTAALGQALWELVAADLPVYLRQCHTAWDLAALGQLAAQAPAGGWRP